MNLSETYYVVGHFHYVMAVSGTLSIFAGVYYWCPKMTGRMYNERWGHIGFWFTFVGANVTFWTMMDIGARIGLPRRYYDWAQFPEAANAQIIMTVGAVIIAIGFTITLLNWIIGAAKGPKAGDNPWGSKSLEWTTVSPPPHGNWPTPPWATGVPMPTKQALTPQDTYRHESNRAPAGALFTSTAQMDNSETSIDRRPVYWALATSGVLFAIWFGFHFVGEQRYYNTAWWQSWRPTMAKSEPQTAQPAEVRDQWRNALTVVQTEKGIYFLSGRSMCRQPGASGRPGQRSLGLYLCPPMAGAA